MITLASSIVMLNINRIIFRHQLQVFLLTTSRPIAYKYLHDDGPLCLNDYDSSEYPVLHDRIDHNNLVEQHVIILSRNGLPLQHHLQHRQTLREEV